MCTLDLRESSAENYFGMLQKGGLLLQICIYHMRRQEVRPASLSLTLNSLTGWGYLHAIRV